MGTAEKQKKNRAKYQWMRRKSVINENINDAIHFNNKALKSAEKAQKDIGIVVPVLRENQIRLNQMKVIYGNDDAYPNGDSVAASSIAVMVNLSASEKQSAQRIAAAAGRLATPASSLMGTVLSSDAVIGTMGTTTYYIAQRMCDAKPIEQTIKEIGEPTAKQRKEFLLPKLKEIKPELATKLEGAWQTLYDQAKADRFSQAANSAREVMSDVLCTLSPDAKVKTLVWFKPETINKEPSQRQRAKYAILGTSNLLIDEDLEPIYQLTDSTHELYQRLSKIAHQRQENDEGLQTLTENLINEVQIYLYSLIELRRAFFKE